MQGYDKIQIYFEKGTNLKNEEISLSLSKTAFLLPFLYEFFWDAKSESFDVYAETFLCVNNGDGWTTFLYLRNIAYFVGFVKSICLEIQYK